MKRNLKIGYVCVLKDPNAMRGEWRLCRVVDVFPDESNTVRNVEIIVAPPSLHDATKPYKKGVSMIKLKRHVNNLVVIVPHEEDDVGAGHGGECKNE